MKTLKLRDYQTEAIQALHAAWDSGMKRPAVLLPTGMGKTVIFAELVRMATESGRRPVVLVHRDELAKQTVEKIGNAAPGAKIGVIKAERNEWNGVDVAVASVQTLGRPARLARVPVDAFDLVIVDECHHAAADSYLRVLQHFGCFTPGRNALAAGFTATMQRQDSRGLGNVWESIAYRKDILYGIGFGYLVDVRGKAVTVDGLDLASVARNRGDYAEGALGDAMEAAGAGQIMAEAYAEHAMVDGRYRQGILFAPTVSSARAFAEDFNSAGIRTEVITGDTPTEERDLIYKRARAGETTVLASCMVLTEGFDMPEMEVAVVARPTSSSALYVQMVGRVLRPAPWAGKKDALVLDVVGVSSRLKLACIADLTETKVTPKDGESLAEAIKREAEEAGRRPRARVNGALAAIDVDLFHRSPSAWLRTPKGVWFVPTKSHTFFLWPNADGTYRVGRCGVYSAKDGKWLFESLPMEMAMAWAEDAATEADPSISRRSSSWRKNPKPSTAQIGLLARHCLPYDESTTRAQASDMLSIYYAAKILDRGIKS